MRIIEIEQHQSLPLNPSENAMSWFWQEKYPATLEEMFHEFNAGTPSQPWRVVPAARLIRIWNDTAKTGVVRDVKGLDAIGDQIIDLVARLYINTEVGGHTEAEPADILGDEIPDEEEQQRFIEWAIDTPTGWRLTDAGFPRLTQLAGLIYEADTPEARLTYIDMALNIVHQRSDMAGWFVQGGTGTLNQLAQNQNESLREAFSTAPVAWHWMERGAVTWAAEFTIGKMIYRVLIEHFGGRPDYDLNFTARKKTQSDFHQTQQATGTGNANAVYSTLLDVVKKFLAIKPVQSLKIESDTTERSRHGVNIGLAKKIAAMGDFEIDHEDDSTIRLIKRDALAESEEDEMEWVKVWLNGQTGEAITFDIYESHENQLRANPAKFGLTREDVGDDDEANAITKAVENGWIRIANFSDAALIGIDHGCGYVNANSTRDLRYGLAWLRKHNYLPDKIDIEQGYGNHRRLQGEEIDKYIRGAMK